MDLENLYERWQYLGSELKALDPECKRAKEIREEMKDLSEMIDRAEKRETDRINSYHRNDLDQQKIIVDERRIRIDKLGHILGIAGKIGTCVISGALAIGGMLFARHDDISAIIPNREISSWVSKLFNNVR